MPQYSLSFTAASLRPDLARIVAETFLACGDWECARQRILSGNSLQSRTHASAVRMEREFRQRLQTLSRRQLEILAHAPSDSRRAIAWLAVLKHSGFVFAFSAEILRGKVDAMDPVLRPSDYERFIAEQTDQHPELEQLATTTKVKIHRVLKTMLREAGIIDEHGRELFLRRPILPPDVLSSILVDNPKWLAGFLIPDNEIAKMKE